MDEPQVTAGRRVNVSIELEPISDYVLVDVDVVKNGHTRCSVEFNMPQGRFDLFVKSVLDPTAKFFYKEEFSHGRQIVIADSLQALDIYTLANGRNCRIALQREKYSLMLFEALTTALVEANSKQN